MTIPVTYFPKRCPHCREVLDVVEKLRASWLQCGNDACPFLATQKLPKDRPSYVLDTWMPSRYKYAFHYR